MKKAIVAFSIITSMFVLGLFMVPKHSEASFWDHVSISFGVGMSTTNTYGSYGYGNSGYGNNNYGYGNGYSAYPAVYGYGNSYNDYYDNSSTIYPRYGAYNTGYGSYNNYNNYGGYNNGYGYPSSYPVCMTRPC